MTTTAVPSKLPEDFSLNIDNLDKFSNGTSPTFTNRLGVTKKTISGIVDAGQMALSVEVFATAAAGLAATAAGKYFSVPSPESSEFLILYLNSAGVAVEKDRYPSADAVVFAMGAAYESFSLSDATRLEVRADSGGSEYGWCLPDGTEVADDFKTKAGDSLSALGPKLSYATLDLDVPGYLHIFNDADGKRIFSVKADGTLEGLDPSLSGIGLAEVRAGAASLEETRRVTMRLDKRKAALQTPLKLVAEIAPFGADGKTTQRMATVERVGKNRLIVIFSQFDVAGSDQSNGRLVYRFVDFDLQGGTVAPGATVVLDAPTEELTKSVVAHPHSIILRQGPNVGRLLILYNRGTGLVSRYSDDKGVTWSAPVIIPSVDQSWLSANGTLVEIPYGKYKGRLVSALWTYGNIIWLTYSDDHGATWKMGSTLNGSAIDSSIYFINESSVAFCHDGSLLVTSREESSPTNNGHDTVGKVIFSKSNDGGETLTPIGFNPNLEASQTTMGLVQMALESEDGVPKILLSHPTQIGFGRYVFRIRISYDCGATFPITYTPIASDLTRTGYTALKPLDDQTFVMVQEVGSPTTFGLSIYFINFSEVIANGTGF